MGLFSALLAAFGCGKAPTRTDNPYHDLRNQVFSVRPEQLGISSSPVWGLLMETGYPEAVVTLVALGDGTVSMYFSNGGGAIGLGEHEITRKISKELLLAAPQFAANAAATSEYPLPEKGETRFYFLTPEGVKTFHAPEVDLGENRSKLSPLFYKCHELIGASREFMEGKKA